MKFKAQSYYLLLIAVCLLSVACGEQHKGNSAEYLQRAEQALFDNKPLVANIEAKNALLENEDNLQARWILAQAYLKLREGLAAETEVNKLLEDKFEHAKLALIRYESLLLQGKYDEVVQLATTNQISSDELAMRALAYISLADIQRGARLEKNRQGYVSLARSDLTKALEMDRANQTVYLALSKLALRERDFEQARAYLDSAERLDASNGEVWNQRGIVGQMTADFAYAEDSYRKAAEMAPYNLLFNLNFGRILIARNKGGEALDVLDEQARLHTKMPTLQYLRALAFIQGGELERASDVLHGVVQEFPNYIEAQFLLGRILTDLGQYGQAEVAIGTVLEFFPEHAEANKLLTQIREAATRGPETLEQALSNEAILGDLLGREQEHLSDAEVTLRQQHTAERLLQERKVFLEAPQTSQRQIVLALSQRGDYQKIIDLALARAQHQGNDAQAADWAGLANMLHGDFEVAREFLNAALRRDPNLVSAINNLADLEFRLQNLAAAEKLFERALALAPDDPVSMLGMARLSIVRGEFHTASELIQRAAAKDGFQLMTSFVNAELIAARGDTEQWYRTVEHIKTENTNVVEPYLMLARFHARRNETDKALQYIAEAEANTRNSSELRKSKVYVYSQLGRTALAAGDHQQAGDAFDQVLELAPKNVAALNNLAWIYQQQGRSEALELAEQAYLLNPESALVLDTLGWILLDHKEFERAADLLNRARKQAPNVADIRYHYAVVLERLGRRKDALAQVQVALEKEDLSQREEATALLEILQ